jgi:hypothetical protein
VCPARLTLVEGFVQGASGGWEGPGMLTLSAPQVRPYQNAVPQGSKP